MPTAAAEDPAVSSPAADPTASAERASDAPSGGPTGDGAPTRAGDGSAAGGRLEDLFHGHPEDHTGNRPPAKKKRRTGCLVALVIVLAVIGGIVGAGVWAWNAYGEKISDALGWGDPCLLYTSPSPRD